MLKGTELIAFDSSFMKWDEVVSPDYTLVCNNVPIYMRSEPSILVLNLDLFVKNKKHLIIKGRASFTYSICEKTSSGTKFCPVQMKTIWVQPIPTLEIKFPGGSFSWEI